MSAAPVSSVAAAAQAAALVLRADDGPSPGLVLGQIVQAKVLHQLDAGRYLVRLGAQDRIVESALPLRPDEVLSLRVGGSRDRIELERVERNPSETATPLSEPGDEAPPSLVGGGAAALVEELFRRYRGTLEAEEGERLRRSVTRASRPEHMALAGLVLSKAGLPIRAELLTPLYEAIGVRPAALAPIPESSDAESGAPSWWPPAQIVLNAQGGGTIGHQVGTIPVQTPDGVLTVEVALFEERNGTARPPKSPPSRHRKAVLALQTEHLGCVELRAVMADKRMRVALVAESREATSALLRHGEALVHALGEAGWQVDEISHETRAAAAPNSVVSAAVEHIITPGSVSRLL